MFIMMYNDQYISILKLIYVIHDLFMSPWFECDLGATLYIVANELEVYYCDAMIEETLRPGIR